MKHFLITRFNLRHDGWTAAKDGQLVLNEDWLSQRFNLFNHYCLPSVKNQSNQNFFWSVFFDTETPQIYKEIIEQISESYSVFQPIYINGYPELLDSLKNFIHHHIGEKDEYIITTRLDNDDLIHKDFIDSIQNLFKPIDKMVIDLRHGYQICVKGPKNEIREYDNSFNPFVSLVESRSYYKTVLSQMHRDWKNANATIVFDKKRLWIELIHQKNKLNEVDNNLKRVSSIKNTDFGLSSSFAFKDTSKFIILINFKLGVMRLMAMLKKSLKGFSDLI